MRLEDRGWKGRKRAAFLKDAGLATFLRAMGRALGREGKCRIYWLSVDQKMIAGERCAAERTGRRLFLEERRLTRIMVSRHPASC